MLTRTFFKELNTMQKEFDQLLGELGFDQVMDGKLPLMTDRFDVPAINAGEDDNNFYVEAQLPGFALDDIRITVQRNQLHLSGKRERAKDESIRWHRVERGFGAFERTLRLPRDVDAEQVTAEARHGIIRITLPKAASAKPKQITIHGA